MGPTYRNILAKQAHIGDIYTQSVTKKREPPCWMDDDLSIQLIIKTYQKPNIRRFYREVEL